MLDLALPDFLEALFTPHCELVPWERVVASDVPRDDVRAILTYAHPTVDAALLTRLPALEVISNYGVGVDHIVLEDCARAGVPVGNTPGAVNGATADLTIALLLAAARNVVPGDRFARGPDFKVVDPGILLGTDVFGATLGIVGMGAIGCEVARRAQAFDMRIVYHNRRRDEAAEAAYGASYVDLATLLETSDFVSLNMPLTEDTRSMIGPDELALMPPHAYLINAARGGVVDTEALTHALTTRQIAGAALDVTEPEPLPRDHQLLKLDNVVVLPHLGTSTVGTRTRMGHMALDNLLAGLNGEALPNRVV
ncbi:MAG: D-glycerate dehydrogenase [Pseudomonadota bacterium]